MKTLDQIEARTPVAASPAIPAAGPHITISQPGSYYLTGNITVASGNAIVISASDVTLDLNGFTVSGPANQASSNYCIHTVNAGNISVKNGTVSNMGYGIGMFGTTANNISQSIERVNFIRCYVYGIYISTASSGTRISSCAFSQMGKTSSGLTPIAIHDSGGIRVENCTIGDVTATVSPFISQGISGALGSFYINNTISNCTTGIFSGKYKDNSFYNCTTTVISGADAGGNN